MKQANKATRILLVDDEPNILLAVEFLLKKEGYTLSKAFDGQQALEKVITFQPDIVVLDVMMPGLDGFEVAHRIRNIDDCKNVCIIFLTAKGTKEDKLKGYGSGGEFYLTKPFENDELVRVVNEFVAFNKTE
jgi:DNA-binding response OmpR family regulator